MPKHNANLEMMQHVVNAFLFNDEEEMAALDSKMAHNHNGESVDRIVTGSSSFGTGRYV
jgi:hypothetical protein